MTIHAFWRETPFSPRLHHREVVAGTTIAQIVASIDRKDLPVGFDRCGKVLVNDMEVPREAWHRVRPRAGVEHETVVNLCMPLQGGGGGEGGGGKNTWATVGLAAVAIAAILVSGGALAGAFPALAAPLIGGVTGAQVLGVAIAPAGPLAAGVL